jgi:predicted alpha/beta hydrolase
MSSMRPPLREIEPLMLGVSMATRALCLSAASRVSGCWAAGAAAGWPGTGTGVLGVLPGAGVGTFWV